MQVELNSGVTMKLNSNTADEITRLSLLECVRDISESRALLKARKRTGCRLHSGEIQDIKNMKKNIKAMKHALRYFSTPDQWNSYGL